MTAQDVLTLLRRSGFEVRLRGGSVLVRPSERLDAAMRDQIRQHKTELLALLASEAITPATRHYDGPTPPCPQCGGPTHDALDHAPGIVVLLCDDERCRWVTAMTTREFAAWIAARRQAETEGGEQ